MRLRCVTAVLAVLPFATFTVSLRAQQPLRVIRHTPADTARPGDVITISFNRPVVGSLASTSDPSRLVRIDPDPGARVEWRDPATIRIVPRVPLTPGQRYRFRLSSEVGGGGGGDLSAPYEFTLTVRGPAVITTSPALHRDGVAALEPNGRIRILYSAPVDSAQFSRVARVEMTASPPCAARVVRYAVRSQRSVSDTDDFQFRYAGFGADSVDGTFRRLVEIGPAAPIPEECPGVVVLPSLDPNDRVEIRYRIVTAPKFTVEALRCLRDDCAAERDLWLDFTAPVTHRSLVTRLHLTPAVKFTIPAGEQPSTRWRLQMAVTPRTTYRVRVDSTLTDVFGRRLGGQRSATLTVGDRQQSLGHQLGFFNVPRGTPVLRLTHVNIDSAVVTMARIPDSLRTLIVRLSADSDSVARIISRLPDVVVRRIGLPNALNVERITEFVLPASVLEPSAGSQFRPLVAVRARAVVRQPPNELKEVHVATRDGRPFARVSRVAILQPTDLLAQAKVSDNWGAVFVTSGSSGRAVLDARVVATDSIDRVISLGATDSTGVARLAPVARTRGPAPHDDPAYRMGYGGSSTDVRLVEVVQGSDRALTAVPDREWWGRQDGVQQLGGVLWPARTTHASAFADRGIYRPNEIVYLSAILRLGPESALELPNAGDSIRMRVALPPSGSAAGRVIRDTVVRVDAFGTVADSFKLGASATLGTYQVTVDGFNGAWQHAGSTSFAVSEYRTPEFETSLRVDSGVRFRGDTIRAHARGNYYFGPSMRGAVMRWTASLSDMHGGLSVPGLPGGYSIGMTYAGGEAPSPAYSQQSGTDTLDARGEASFEIPTPATGRFPLSMSVSVTTIDANRQAVGAHGYALLHSSSVYVAVRDSSAREWYWKADQPRTIAVLTVRPSGERVGDVRLRVMVLRHHVQYATSGNGQYPATQWATDTVLVDSVTTRSSGAASFTYTPTTSEWHELVFTGADAQGRPFASALGGYVLSDGRARWDGNPVRLAMRIDNASLAVGDSMDVRFISPFARAEAWVTVEREAVLMQRRLSVGRGESVVRLPVTANFYPGAHVGIVLVDSGSAWRADSLHERIRAGYEPIYVSESARELSVRVAPSRRNLAPGDSATMTVSVRDAAGRPVRAHVTLWAVNEGALALASYTRPNPLTALHAGQATGLMFVTNAAELAARRRFLPAPYDFLFDEGQALQKLSADLEGRGLASGAALGTAAGNSAIVVRTIPRSDFRTTAFYLSTLVTDADGNVSAAVKLPDNVTRYRVIAVAVSAGDSYGSGDSTIVVSRPLLARAALPRFVREGDSLMAGAVVNNNIGAQAVTHISATGTGLRRVGAADVTRTIANNGTSEVRFSWQANSRAGETALVRFQVTADTNADVVDTRIPVRAPYSPRYHTLSGIARDSATVRMMLPADIDPKRSRLTLRVGTSPLPVIRAAYWQLEAYPYLCSEQLTSNGRVILSLLRMQRAGLADSTVAPTARTLRARLQYIVDELSRRQGRDGGIGYWNAASWTSAWLSTYAGTLLIDARDAGATVDSSVVAAIVRSLPISRDSTLRVEEGEYGTAVERRRAIAARLSRDLAMLQLVRRTGAPNVTREDGVAAQASTMTWEDRVWLVDLLSRRDDKRPASEQLARVWRDVEMAGVRVDIPDSLLVTLGFPSHVRPVARLLLATLALEPNHPLLPALIDRIVQQGRAQRSWRWNTQDVAWASTAMAELAIVERSVGPVPSVNLRSALRDRGQRALMTSSDSSISLNGLVERDGEWMTLPIHVASTGRVFYVLTVDEVPLVPPTTPDAQGIIVERWFEGFEDGRPVTDVVEGTLVRGRLRVTVPADREFVAVEDLLPAGLEVVDMSLRTSAIEVAAAPGRSPESWWSPWEHTELRDDRVMYFARTLWKGTYSASYVARATTAGSFVKPPAHAEEMYNPSLGGRSDGGTFRVLPKP